MKKLLLLLALIPTIQAMQPETVPSQKADLETIFSFLNTQKLPEQPQLPQDNYIRLQDVNGRQFRVAMNTDNPTIADLFKAAAAQLNETRDLRLVAKPGSQNIVLNDKPATTPLKELGLDITRQPIIAIMFKGLSNTNS